jgi:hypothetical protein
MFRFSWSVALAAAVCLFTTACKNQDQSAVKTAEVSQAPGCVSLTKPVPTDSTALTENVRGGGVYSCMLNAKGPRLRVTMVIDTSQDLVSGIEVRRDSAAAPFQTLAEGQSESPYRGADYFVARDLDNDGYLDFMLLSNWGVTGNNTYNVWRWNVASSRFVFDSTLSTLTAPTPIANRACVNTRSTGGDAGAIYEAATLCLDGDKWNTMSAERQTLSEKLHAHIHTVLERSGDSLRVIRVDTMRDKKNR